MTTISVIVVAHNEEHDVARAVQSVLAQTYTDFELIIVDDASTDRTWQVIQSFDDPRIVRHQRLSANGAGAARNAAIALAKHEWLALLDADDCWHADKLTQQIALAKVSNADAVLSGFRLFRAGGAAHETYLNNLPEPWPRAITTGCHFSPGSGLLIKKPCFETHGGFDENLRRLEDWDWWLRAAAHITTRMLPVALMDIHMGTAPSYLAVADACRWLRRKHFVPILKQFGLSASVQLWVTLKFECAAVAFGNRMMPQFIWHMLSGGALHPRLWKKLLRRK